MGLVRIATLFLLLTAPFSVWAQQQSATSDSMTVEQAVQEAIQHNLDLLAERQNVPVARARIITAKLRPNPQFSVNSDYLDWFRQGVSQASNLGPPEVDFRVDYTVEGGGKRARRIEEAQLSLTVAELRLMDTVRQLVVGVQGAAVDYLQAQADLQLAQQNLKVFDEIIQVNDAKVKAGDLAGVELARTQLAREQFRTAVAQAELRQQQASNRLQTLLGRKQPTPGFQLMGALDTPSQSFVLDDLRANSLANRPDLLAQRKDAQRAEADIRLQKANGKIDYTFGTALKRQYGYAQGETFGVYLQMPLPVFNRNQGEIARAQVESEQSQIRVQALEANISSEVDSAYRQYDTARTLLQRFQGGLMDQAKQVREITEYSYRRGEASFLEFLDAQRAFNDAVQSFNGARADYLRSLYTIDAVTGKSVQP